MADDLDLFGAASSGLSQEHFGLTDDGAPYVVAGALAKALGYRDSEKATRLLDADEKGTQIRGTPGGDQRVSVIYEAGIWRLVFRSNLPSARSLTKRVTEILAELRRTGVVDTREKPFTELELAERYVTALRRLEIAAPKAESWDQLAAAEGDYSLREAAQILCRDPAINTGQNRLAKYLRYGCNWCDHEGRPYQKAVDAGRLRVRAVSYPHPTTGEQQTTRQVRVTARGLGDLHRLLGGDRPLLITPPEAA